LFQHSLTYEYRGRTYSSLELHEKAVEDYTESIKLDEGNAPVYVNRGVSPLKIGHYQRAISDFNKAKTMGDDASVFRYLGESYLRIGQLDKAAEELESAVRRLNDSDSWRLRGALYAMAGDLDQAVWCLSESEMMDWSDSANNIGKANGTTEQHGQILRLQARITERKKTVELYQRELKQLEYFIESPN
jgi:tetratricopeptide (TPR) repeat protein